MSSGSSVDQAAGVNYFTPESASGQTRILVAIATIATVLMLVLAWVSRIATYRVAPVFLIPLLWGIYFARRKLDLHPVHYTLFALAILLHMLGALGYYQNSPLG